MTVAAQRTPESYALLRIWERSAGWTTMSDDALMPDGAASDRPPRALGDRNATLLDLHERLFGTRMDLLSRCPSCDAAVEFESDCAAMRQDIPPVDAGIAHRLSVGNCIVDFRVPTLADVAAVTADGIPEFIDQMLDRCVLRCTREGETMAARELPAAARDALSERLQVLDPGANLGFLLVCPDCQTRWEASLDVARVLWHKVRTAAEQLLLDIDTLARAYGWREEDVLRLSPFRRAAYVVLASS